ncbi:hypothetical protein BKA70DRAFT_862528 [Coprinopsis sp. MPI-PUGE-AT-0042]|nr:hypothetical protein BKA70DRAFT_862528 [Coprinopsis sp. MPI-PUGE-AT-0042]
MDIAGLIINIVGAARGIHTFLDENRSKKEKFRQLKWRVLALIDILSPLAGDDQHNTLHHLQEGHQIGSILIELAEILSCIRERILAYNDNSKFGSIMDFVNPTVLLGKLEDDEKRLSRWIELFILKLQIAQHLSGEHQDHTSKPADRAIAPLKRAHNLVRTTDAARFWNTCIGKETNTTTPAVFFAAMNGWLRRRLEGVTYASIRLELDPEEFGMISRKKAFQVIGSLLLETFVYEHEQRASDHGLNVMALGQGRGLPASRLKEDAKPMIVWVDDKMDESDFRIQQTRSHGIQVILLSSTATAKTWITAHKDSLRRLETLGALQFITDNIRWEKVAGSKRVVKNISAGETMLRFVRGNRFMAPVLVYCGESIGTTGYVASYNNAASTTAYQVFQDFAAMALASKRSIDEGWSSQSRISYGFDIRNLPGTH